MRPAALAIVSTLAAAAACCPVCAPAWGQVADATSAPSAPAASPAPASAADAPRFRKGGGGGLDPLPTRPDLSADFDPFAPDDTPPPRAPRFDPARPALGVEADPLAALIRNGPRGAVFAPSAVDEPWRLPGVRRTPTLADPPPGSAPATKTRDPAVR